MNRILEIIRYWLQDHSYDDCSDMSRADLIAWMKRGTFNGGTLSVQDIYALTDEQLELTADCLIEAGIGNEREQNLEVSCFCSYRD